MNKKQPVVFSPANEPYLGRESLHAFDDLIVVCLKNNSRIATYSHQIDRSDLQLAACRLAPQGVSLSLSIRELIRQGYLFGASVLLRPLAERAATLLYLHKVPDALTIWNRGWKYRERPKLAAILEKIGPPEIPDVGKKLTNSLNSLIHGDEESEFWNMVVSSTGEPGQASSKILNRTDLCDQVAGQSAVWMSVLLCMMVTIFPNSPAE